MNAVLHLSLLAAAVSALCIVANADSPSNSPLSKVRESIRGLETRAQSGDLLFRRQSTFLSNTVLRFDSGGTYSHVGLIRREGDDVWVIHTVPASGASFSGGVQLDTLRSYLEGPETAAYALFRPSEALRPAALRAADEALRFYERRIPFDTEFRIDSSDRLYCTELVWRAYLQSGVELLTDLPANLTAVPLSPSGILLPSALQLSPHLHLISSERNLG